MNLYNFAEWMNTNKIHFKIDTQLMTRFDFWITGLILSIRIMKILLNFIIEWITILYNFMHLSDFNLTLFHLTVNPYSGFTLKIRSILRLHLLKGCWEAISIIHHFKNPVLFKTFFKTSPIEPVQSTFNRSTPLSTLLSPSPHTYHWTWMKEVAWNLTTYWCEILQKLGFPVLLECLEHKTKINFLDPKSAA